MSNNNIKDFKTFTENIQDNSNIHSNDNIKNKFVYLTSDVKSENEKINVGRIITFKEVYRNKEYVIKGEVVGNEKYNKLDVEVLGYISGYRTDIATPYKIGDTAIVHIGNIVNPNCKLNESTDKDKYELVVFMQGEEAEIPLELLADEGEKALLEYLKQWYYLGEHESVEKIGAGTSDSTYTEGNYTVVYNTRIGYVGLYYKLDESDSIQESFPCQVYDKEGFTQIIKFFVDADFQQDDIVYVKILNSICQIKKEDAENGNRWVENCLYGTSPTAIGHKYENFLSKEDIIKKLQAYYKTGNIKKIVSVEDLKKCFTEICEKEAGRTYIQNESIVETDKKIKGLSVNVYQSRWIDPLSILPKEQMNFLLVDETGNFPDLALSEVSDDKIYLKLKSMTVGKKIHYYAVPSNLDKEKWSMFGGRFVYSSDSRFSQICGYPIGIHDRVEGRG